MLSVQVKPDWKFITSCPAYFLAFGCGSGLLPWAPGTWGTLMAFPLSFGLAVLGIKGSSLAWCCVPLFIVGVKISDMAEQALKLPDHSGVNIDETVAMLLVLSATPPYWLAWVVAFALFRLLDISKPWPICWLDQHIHGGIGMMVDDIAAAIMTIAILYLLQSINWL